MTFMSKKHVVYTACAVFCALLIILSVTSRFPQEHQKNYYNSNATYHALLTIRAYQETPAAIHHFLPIVSLGHEFDKHIPWGGTIPDQHGNYYYTSFSPAGYIVPYAFINLFHMPVNEQSLFIFNSILYVGSFLLAARLFVKLFGDYMGKPLLVVLTALLYLFQPEILHSQGIVYWHQSLFQLLFLFQLNLLTNLHKKLNYFLFMLLCFVLPYVEWTGFVGNAGIVVAILICGKGRHSSPDETAIFVPKKIISSLLICFLTALSFAAFAAHYLSVVSCYSFIMALKSRFMQRSITAGESFMKLLDGYIASFGLLLLFAGLLLIAVMIDKNARSYLGSIIRRHRVVVIVLAFCLLENVVMLQHAIYYSYDRIKAVFILIYFVIACISSLAHVHKKIAVLNRVYVGVFMLVAVINLALYNQGNNRWHWDAAYLTHNNELRNEVNSLFTHENSVFAQGTAICGYTNMLFARGVYEGVPYITESIKDIARNNDKQYVVLLLANVTQWYMYEYSDYLVFDLQKERVINDIDFTKYGLDPISAVAEARFFLSDSDWERGYSNLFAGFFVPNVSFYRELYRIGNLVEIDNGDIREVLLIEEHGEYLHVHLSGECFPIEDLDYPTSLNVIMQ